MPKMFTNTARMPAQPGATGGQNCLLSYQEYAAQRVTANSTAEKVDELTERFRVRISDPIDMINPDIEMGQYFVIPVAEIRELLNSAPNIEFIHVCNALREATNSALDRKVFPVTMLVPIVQNNATPPAYEVCNTATAVFIEAYPCPPDPRCPKPNELLGTVLKPNTKFNDFKSLL